MQISDRQRGDNRFDETDHGQVRDHHGGDGLRKSIRRIKGGSVGGLEEVALDAHLEAGQEGCHVDAHIGADTGGQPAPAGARRGSRCHQPVHIITNEWQGEGHVEAIGADGQEAAVAEEERLHHQRHCH